MSHHLLSNDSVSLQELMDHTTSNNERLREKKRIMDEKIKRIKELKQEQTQRQSQAALQNQSALYDTKIAEMEKTLASQQEKIKEQIRLGNEQKNSHNTNNNNNNFGTGDQYNSSAGDQHQTVTNEILEVLKLILREKRNMLENTRNMVKVLNTQYQQNKDKEKNSNIPDLGPSTQQYISPILEKINQNLANETEKQQVLQRIIKKKNTINEQLEVRIRDLKRQVQNHKQNHTNSSGNKATNPIVSNESVSKITPTPGFPSSTSSNSNSNDSTAAVSSIQASYLNELSNKHYPTPLKKRSSISESLDGSRRHTNTRAGYLYNQTYRTPDTQFPSHSPHHNNNSPDALRKNLLKNSPNNPKSQTSKQMYLQNQRNKFGRDPPPYPGKSTVNDKTGMPGMPTIESETDSNSPNSSLNLGTETSKIKNARQTFLNLDKQNKNNNVVKDAAYFSKQIAQSHSGTSLSSITNNNNKPLTPLRTTSKNNEQQSASSPNSGQPQQQQLHPVDLAIKKSQGKQIAAISPNNLITKNDINTNSPSANNANQLKSNMTSSTTIPLTQKDNNDNITNNNAISTEQTKYQKYLNEQKTDGIRHNKLDGSPIKSILVAESCSKNYDNANKTGTKLQFDPFDLLLDASLEGEFEEVKRVIKLVKNPSKSNPEGITALHNAVCAGNMEIVEFLVHYGVDINAVDSDGWTPLHCAASCNNKEMTKFLIERGAAIFAKTIWDQGTAADKCEELDDRFHECSTYLYGQQEKIGLINKKQVYALYDYDGTGNDGNIKRPDELCFKEGDLLTVIKRTETVESQGVTVDDLQNNASDLDKKMAENSTEVDSEWWYVSNSEGGEGYVPRNYLGMWPRIHAVEQK